ncbi:MAG: tetratricopeptide repeat protein [Pirellulaceae bacterium]|nr:tetratricopeptide repeat protein [Pirellulaceae bacterium]
MSGNFRLVLLAGLLAFPLFLGARSAAGNPPPVPEAISRLMQDRDYDGAVEAIEQQLKQKDSPADYLLYLQGRARHLQHRYDDAAAVYDRLVQQFPDSPWARRARFAKAVALARKGDFREAELIYRAEAEYLFSPERKQEIASIYLEFADALFQPDDEQTKPDYAKALEFYNRALQVGPQPQTRRETELKAARCQQQLGQHAEAAAAYQQFVKQNPDDPLLVEARYRLGEAYLAQGNLAEARRTWQDLLELHRASDSPRLADARFEISRTYNIPQPQDDEQLNLGVAALRAFLREHPDHKLASQAHLRIAESYQHRGRHEDAVAAARGLLAEPRYADREEIPRARFLLGHALQMQKKFAEALEAFRQFLTSHPTDRAWSDVQRAIIDTEYFEAQARFDEKQHGEARKLWEQFLDRHPLDERNRTILLQLGRLQFDQRQWDEAIADWRRLVSKYPGTEEASHAQFLIAVTLEEKLGQLEEALKEFRKLNWGSRAPHAQARIARLTARSLSVATPRIFRSGQTPQLKLVTRNIESVHVRAYQVDLETYFRKMHLARGVEQLDISLIDPDQAFDFAVPKYQPYQQLEHALEVRLPAAAGDQPAAPNQPATAGVMAVTVSGKTLEATTLVVHSDLDIIVKSSRDEIFVFAQNMRTGKPWPGARLLISDGEQVFGEGVTGDDGVYRGKFEQLKTAEDIRVFAISDQHTASNVVGLAQVEVAQGLAPKGYIYTDRPAYRPGQMVHIRGVVRHVAGDTYRISEGKQYQLEVRDERNRLVHSQDVALNAFGSFHANFLLPETSVQGQYRIAISDQEQETFQGTLQVEDYQPPTVRLEVDTPRRVYYRGEEIEGTIRVKYYYGAPVVGRDVRYRLADGRVFTARTDEKGEVGFLLPTREFRETQALPFSVELPDLGLQSQTVFQLATLGFTLQAALPRPVFLAGETFELTVTAADAEGQPISQPVELHVLRRTVVEGQVGEVEVQRHELRTAEDGRARQTLELDTGGEYVLRLIGIDRFQNPVTAQSLVNISDDKDQVRLRILSDRHTYRAGDQAQIRVHWREQPALALVTFQGARILDYRLITLRQGENILPVPMDARLAPNFDLAVAVMTDPAPPAGGAAGEGTDAAADQAGTPRRFHEASSPFTVERDLHIQFALKPVGRDAGPIRPGDEVEVVVTATDPQGRPVAAEVGLALIEKSLLDRFGFQVPAIQEYFRGANRQAAMRTTSSVVFEYRPSTRQINPLLLAEAERREVEEEEARRLTELATNGRPTGGDVAAAGVAANNWAALGDRAAVNGEAFGMGMGQANSYPPSSDTIVDRQLRSRLGRFQARGMFSPDGAQLAVQDEDNQQLGILSLGVQQRQELMYDFNGNQSELPAFYTEFGRPARGRYGAADLKLMILTDGIAPTTWEALSGNAAEIPVLQKDGVWFNLNTARVARTALGEVLTGLAAEEAVVLTGLRPHETAYWNPAVTTDDQGRASVRFTLPERSTAWTLLGKGITAETLAGEQSEELVVRKDLFGELKLPSALTDGDRAEIGISVHNDALAEGTIDVTLNVKLGDKTTSVRKQLDVDAKGIRELTVTQPIELPKEARQSAAPGAVAEFELIVSAGELRDVARRVVPVVPYGRAVFAVAGGTAQGDVNAVVEAPPGMPLAAPRLQILVGPTVQRSLLDAVLGAPTWCQLEGARVASGVDTASSDLMAALALQQLLAGTRDATAPQAETLDSRIRSAIGLLVSLQNDDGGWNWAGRQGQASDRYSSARVFWSLSLARQAGYRVTDETFNSALTYLKSQIAQSAVADFETKAILLQALAAAGQGDFTLANQLYRNRPALSPAGLAHLALAFADMDRRQTAGELLELLAQKNLDAAPQGGLSWNHAGTELRAIYALALDKVTPADDRLRQQVDWLMAHRTGHRWLPDKATGPAMQALCRWFGRTRFEGQKYELTIFVNDQQAHKLQVDPQTAAQTLEVPASFLREGKQRIRFEINGRGQFTFQCVLGGFVAGDQLKSTTAQWNVDRYMEPAPREYDGRDVPRGFDLLLGNYQAFRNVLEQLPVGRRGHVTLRVVRHQAPSTRADETLEYLVVTEPLPAGTTVVEGSLRGGFERYELQPGSITFYLGGRRSIEPITYELHGYLPGSYRAAPTVVHNAFQQDQIAVSKPLALEVLPLGAESGDAYRLTPRELYELGRLEFEARHFEPASRHLHQLVDDWNLQPEIYKDVVRMLLDIHLQLGPPAEVVRHFEIVLEKYEDLEIPFEKLLRIGDAYHQIAEYERSYLVFRAAVEGSFLKESQVAGFLAEQARFLRSVDVMNGLLREYPPEAYVAAASYALAQRVYAKAPEAAGDAELREKKLTRVDLIRQAWRMLDDFLTANPEDPAADEASFSLANALLDLELYEQTIAHCRRFADRYPGSDFLDSYWYIIGFCHFARGEHQDALQMCDKVAQATRVDPGTGREVESQNKWQAIYIRGQVYHSLGQAPDAIREYTRVEDRFADARQAIEYFVRKDISLPEITAFAPGEAVELPLSFRNVAECQATVYRIDLMKFSLLRRTLGGITQINLSGIRPYHEATVPLGDGKDYRDRERPLTLPLKDAGAYLIVCRAGDLHTTGLALVSPLELQIQEEVPSGRVRATVRDKVNNRYVHNVHVKAIGTNNSEFVSGDTDLRGVFVADGLRGAAMVIAQAGDSYAFYRGTQPLGPPPAPAQQQAEAQAESAPAAGESTDAKGELLKSLRGGNEMIQQKQQQQLDLLYRNSVDEGLPSNFGGGLFK